MDDVVLVVGLVDGEVDHEPVGCGAVPVFLVGFEQDAVAGADDFDGSAAALAQADAFGDEDGLAEWVAVPVGSGAGHEVDQVRGDPRRRGCGGDGVDVDVAGEPVAGSLGGGDGAAGDLHQVPSVLSAYGLVCRCRYAWKYTVCGRATGPVCLLS